MRYNLLSPDGRDVGFITDDPEFRWEVDKSFRFRERLEKHIQQSREYEMVVAGGEMAENDVTPPEESVAIDDTGRVIRLASELPGSVPVQVERADEMGKGHIAESLVQRVGKAMNKERVYVEDSSQVPEGVEPQEGEQGGIYYDTGAVEGDDPEGELPWANASFDDFGDVLTEQFGEEFVEDIVETLPESAAPEDAIAMAEETIRENTDEPDAVLNEMYQNLGNAVGSSLGPEGESEEDDVTDPEESEIEVPDGMDIDAAVSTIAGVVGPKAAHALLGDMRAPDSGEAPNPEMYVTQAASSLPQQARSDVQQAINDYNERRDAESEESEGTTPMAQMEYAWEGDKTVEFGTEDGETVQGEVTGVDSEGADVELENGETFEFTGEGESDYEFVDVVEEEDNKKAAQKALERIDRQKNERRESVVKVEELNKPEIDLEKNDTLRKVSQNFIQVDDMLMEAFEKQIWEDDLNKAPNMWQSDDEVPQFVRSHVKDAIENTDAVYGDYSNIPQMAALKVHEIIKDQLTDPSGWSIKTVTQALEEEFEGFAREQAETIARTEVAAVLNKARELGYRASEAAAAANAARNITGVPDRKPDEDEPQYYWAGPQDSHTTLICQETKEIIEDMGGFVSLDELKEILRSKAKEHKEESGGLPERVESFTPHFECRHTFIRDSYQQVT